MISRGAEEGGAKGVRETVRTDYIYYISLTCQTENFVGIFN